MGNDVSDKADAYIETAFDIAKNSDKMAAQRKSIKGDSFANEKQDDAGSKLNPNARFEKLK